MKTNWLETPRGDIRARDAVLYATLSPKGYFSINRMTFQRLGEPQAVHLDRERAITIPDLRP